ncbi:MAG: FHA domain-containing protein [Gammaproteobacteria bacterium]|nr:FHA domain-containing protein [Gammaproteobacteria bacterium]MBU2677769.1 FHA domain-containing protein [Gammaproteobacteria bacterium]NNL51502.1 FHA domain-containing protein [Woeseiaceae bacterium]
MDLGAAGLSQQPFPTHGKPLSVVSYQAERAALEVLQDTYENPVGLCLLQGPKLSGKSTLVRSFIDTLHEDCAVALVDGKGLNTTNLLIGVLRQFGYDVELSSASELLGLIRVFALQQAASHEPALLIIENTHEMKPSALRSLCELADLRIGGASALKIVLVSDRSLASIMQVPAMASVAGRVLHDFHLHPMTEAEARLYILNKLWAAGSNYPESVFPDSVCAELWRASGGWPGILDRLALLCLSRAETLPVPVDLVEHPVLPDGTWDEGKRTMAAKAAAVRVDVPQLIVSHNGKVISDLKLHRTRLLVGRSHLNDLAIDSRFISRHHALLVRRDSSTFLMDLNSSNGTFVNAKRVSNHVLVHNDVIAFGHHKVKFVDPHAQTHTTLDSADLADTAIMKTLDDMRSLLAQENTAQLPTIPEDLSTIQN